MFDCHCHLNFKDFKPNVREVIGDCLANNIQLLIVGSYFNSSQRAVEIASTYDRGVYAAIGLHPTHTYSIKSEYGWESRQEKFDAKLYQKLLHHNVKAVGETGLDYFVLSDLEPGVQEKAKAIQKKVLVQHIKFAVDNDLPLIFHVRDVKEQDLAYVDLAEILNNNYQSISKTGGEVHCYEGSWENAAKYLDMGLHIGFTGIVTYADGQKLSEGQRKRYKNLLEVVKKIPAEKILVETDSPYLLPEPIRSEDRSQLNTPMNLKYILKKIAQVRGMSLEDTEMITVKNARKLFQIGA